MASIPSLPIPRRRRILMAVLWMIGGSSLVFALLVIMNEYIDSPENNDGGQTASFSVERPPPPKPPERKKRKRPKRKRRKSRAAKAPAPLLSASLGGLAIDLPEFDASDLGSLSDSLLGNMDNVVMTENAVDDPPRPLEQTPIAYPKRARAEGVTGYVTVSLLIGPSGEVERSKVLEADPPGVFEETTLQALGSWRFSPAMYQGRPVKVWARKTFRFELK